MDQKVQLHDRVAAVALVVAADVQPENKQVVKEEDS